MGQDLDGEVEGDSSGLSTSLPNDGHIITIGAYGNNGNLICTAKNWL